MKAVNKDQKIDNFIKRIEEEIERAQAQNSLEAAARTKLQFLQSLLAYVNSKKKSPQSPETEHLLIHLAVCYGLNQKIISEDKQVNAIFLYGGHLGILPVLTQDQITHANTIIAIEHRLNQLKKEINPLLEKKDSIDAVTQKSKVYQEKIRQFDEKIESKGDALQEHEEKTNKTTKLLEQLQNNINTFSDSDRIETLAYQIELANAHKETLQDQLNSLNKEKNKFKNEASHSVAVEIHKKTREIEVLHAASQYLHASPPKKESAYNQIDITIKSNKKFISKETKALLNAGKKFLTPTPEMQFKLDLHKKIKRLEDEISGMMKSKSIADIAERRLKTYKLDFLILLSRYLNEPDTKEKIEIAMEIDKFYAQHAEAITAGFIRSETQSLYRRGIQLNLLPPIKKPSFNEQRFMFFTSSSLADQKISDDLASSKSQKSTSSIFSPRRIRAWASPPLLKKETTLIPIVSSSSRR